MYPLEDWIEENVVFVPIFRRIPFLVPFLPERLIGPEQQVIPGTRKQRFIFELLEKCSTVSLAQCSFGESAVNRGSPKTEEEGRIAKLCRCGSMR